MPQTNRSQDFGLFPRHRGHRLARRRELSRSPTWRAWKPISFVLLAFVLLAFLLAVPSLVAAQNAPAVDITSVTSAEDHLIIVHGPVPAGVRRSTFKMDRSEGRFWFRPKARSMQYDAASRSYQDFDVEVGHEYCYVISTRREGQSRGTQGQLSCAVFTGGDASISVPLAPGDLEVVRTRTTNINLEFVDRADNEEALVIERRIARVPDWEAIRTLPAEPGTGRTVKFQDRDLHMEVRYCYRVRAVNDDGSTVSGGACATTDPLVVGTPSPAGIGGPAVEAITHPDGGVLQVRWVDEATANGEWTVYLYSVADLRHPITSARVRDRRDAASRSLRHAQRFEGLEPGEVYCVKVVRGSAGPLGGPRQCESPWADRRQADDLGPDVDMVPRIGDLEASEENGALTIRLFSGKPGQLVDVIRASTGERTTDLRARDGRDNIDVDGLAAGEDWCVRMFAVNRFGSRYGPLECARTRAEPPARPRNLRIESIEGLFIRLRWDPAPRASEYTLRFNGERSAHTDHDGARDGIRDTSYRFEAHSNYSYCFTVEAENAFGTSDKSEALCGVQPQGQGATSYTTRLQPNIPDEGPIIYHHTINPGSPAGARLTEILVVGNDFTPYVVKFIKPAAGTVECPEGQEDGVTVEPGSALAGDGLMTLFGSREPEIGSGGLTVLACKGIRAPGGESTDPIPIRVTYKR